MKTRKPSLRPSRRDFMRALGSLAAGAGAAWAADHCPPGVRTDQGPFYPRSPIPETQDLTRVPGGKGRARGQLLYLFGRITDMDCKPVVGARVEVWQADAGGVYWHPSAADQDQLDPNFRYFAQTETGEDGGYRFKTIVPLRYRFMDLERAPHIHFRIKHGSFRNLTTEMYFRREADDVARKDDRVWLSRPEKTRHHLIVPLEAPAAYAGRGVSIEKAALCCTFDMQLEPREES